MTERFPRLAASPFVPRPAVAALAVLLGACTASSTAPVVERPAPAPVARPAAPVPAPPPRSEFYVVRQGDTLRSIAAANGLDVRALVEMNQLGDRNRLVVGQVLRVRPAPVAAAPAPAPAPSPANEGVQVNEIGGTGSAVEVRPLEGSVEARPPLVVTPATPGAGSAPVTPGAAREPVGGAVRTEPRAFKLPYSDENLAMIQRGEAAAAPKPEAPAVAPPPPAKPEAVAPKPEAGPDATAKADPRARPDANDRDRVDWAWPLAGRVIERFEGSNKGLDIAARTGEAVNAAAPGRVMYAGSGLRGYGQLVIIKHNDTYLSAYAHNSRLLVKEGQTVTRGQKIAEVGQTDADRPKLHFEIRRAGRPVDPLEYLPSRD